MGRFHVRGYATFQQPSCEDVAGIEYRVHRHCRIKISGKIFQSLEILVGWKEAGKLIRLEKNRFQILSKPSVAPDPFEDDRPYGNLPGHWFAAGLSIDAQGKELGV